MGRTGEGEVGGGGRVVGGWWEPQTAELGTASYQNFSQLFSMLSVPNAIKYTTKLDKRFNIAKQGK